MILIQALILQPLYTSLNLLNPFNFFNVSLHPHPNYKIPPPGRIAHYFLVLNIKNVFQPRVDAEMLANGLLAKQVCCIEAGQFFGLPAIDGLKSFAGKTLRNREIKLAVDLESYTRIQAALGNPEQV
jgi:hypothetical protein